MSIEKENFLRTKLVHYMQQLDPATPPRWGKMNVQQMIEHLARDSVRYASGKQQITEFHFSDQELVSNLNFLMSEKPFRENTPNPLMAEEPVPVHFKTVQAAIGFLQQEIIYFFEAYEKNPQLIVRNPFFGDLNFEQNVQLLYKHSIHHLRQFGIEPLTF